jgi:predicted naringenin-chalcone synthase
LDYTVIKGIGTAVPPYCIEQEDAAIRFREALNEYPRTARWVKRIFAQCGVDTRYTCEPNLLEPPEACRYLPVTPEHHIPRTEERMRMYRQEAVPLAMEAARKALADSGNRPADITHLITVSCTGQFLPGLDAELVWLLDLSPDVQRIPLTFLGCAAGLTAVRLADQIVRCNESAKVLAVAVELCTIHMQPSLDKEDLFAAGFFGDGASACVAERWDPKKPEGYVLHEARAELLPGSMDKMTWTLGNYGFHLRLSPEIPSLIGTSIPPAFMRFWGDRSLPEWWAIHPGGRGIIDSLQEAFELASEQTAASRAILRHYGNMSSATILFVMDELRHRHCGTNQETKEGAAIAFGPGMTAEMLRFVYHP